MFLSFAIAGFATMFVKNDVAAAEEEVPPSVTYMLGTEGATKKDENGNDIIYSESMAGGWAAAVKKAVEIYPNLVKVELLKNWETENGNFGSAEESFSSGRIYVPSNTNILLELSGFNLDRKLTAGVLNGQVMLIEGKLTVKDSSANHTGKITGGYNKASKDFPNAFGGGVLIDGGTLVLRNGAIANNGLGPYASTSWLYGAGVCIQNNGTFDMRGGSIYGHTIDYVKNSVGGGVCVYGNGTFNMDGGVIENNTAVIGGGVAIYDRNKDNENPNIKPLVNINGGLIRGNKAIKNTLSSALATLMGGGGLAVYGKGEVNLKSGEIYENFGEEWGGGIYVLAAVSKASDGSGVPATAKLNISGGSIHHNISMGTGPVGGGMAIRNGAASNTGLKVECRMTAGSVDSNTAILTTKSGIGYGGGAYLTSVLDFYLEEGEFTNNRAICVTDTSKLEQVKETFFKGYDTVSGTTDKVEEAEYISDYNTLGGAFNVSGTSNLYISGGRIGVKADGTKAGNRAQQGGAIYLQGYLDMSGGTIAHNMATFGAALRPIYTSTAHSGTVFSGTPVIKDNIKYSRPGDTYPTTTSGVDGTWTGEENGTASNVEINGSDGRVPDIGELKPGADIHISVTGTILEKGQRFTQNYNVHNSSTIKVDGTGETQTVYANPYNYFTSDEVYVGGKLTDQHIVVLYGGEFNDLAMAQYRPVFEINYSDNTQERYLFGEKFDKEITYGNYTFRYPDTNYAEWTYGNTDRHPVSIKAYKLVQSGDKDSGYTYSLEALKADDGEADAVTTVDDKSGIYTLQVKISTSATVSAYSSFSLMVQSRDLKDVESTDDEQASAGLYINVSDDHFKFTNEQKIPSSVTIKIDGIALTEHVDYELTYENNVNAGAQAKVIITFKGNYSGTAYAYFTISSADNYSALVEISWETYTGGGTDGWETFAEGQYDGTFTYNEQDQGYKIRAKITVTDDGKTIINTVYVKDYVASGDDQQNVNVYLVYKVNGEKADFENVGTYSITIDGVFNYEIPQDKNTINGVVMAAWEVELTNSDLANANYVDGSDARLWLLKIGTDEGALYGTLLDSAVYIDPDAEENEFGEKITKGQTPDSYARFRDKQLSLILNVNYVIAGKPLSYWLARATYTISTNGTENGTVLGARDIVTVVTTVVTVTFGENYKIPGGNTITITKTWNIVTISNTLRYASGSREEVEENDVPGWQFGVSTNTSYAFRPEHGNTVFYTYYCNDAFVDRFALVYSDDTADAIRSFYAVNETDGKYAVDFGHPYNDPSYLSNFHYYTLRAGHYKLELYVPDREPSSEQHTHWWNGETANDNGTMYYGFTYVFEFDVLEYDLVTEGGEINTGITVTFPEDGFIYYTGVAGDVVEPEITLNGITLVRGVDYELTSMSIDATNGEKTASLIITGINSLKGTFEFENAFEIRKAFNGWKNIPSIMRWTYFGYSSEIHVLTGEANFGTVWYAVADKDGNVIEGLDKIYLELKGGAMLVSDEVAELLKTLDAGMYKLLAHVTETDNFEGLHPDAIDFQIFQATNSWETTPSVNAWIQGEYVSPAENLLIKPMFGKGTEHIIVKGAKGEVYYDNFKGIDKLAKAKHGFYTLYASVEGTDNYSELYEYRFDFEIFKQPGLPWWATLLIAVGALGLAALILFILWKKGVFQILTEKLTVAIRTRASVEATIASVRAAKMMEEGRQSVAEAKRRERLEQLRKKAQEEREMSPEERAAKLEAKAQADAARAEKLRLRSEAAQRRAEKVRSQGSNGAEDADGHNNPETPTEE